MSNVTLIKITASMELRVTSSPATDQLTFSNYDLSSVSVGQSNISDVNGNIAYITNVSGNTITFVSKDSANPFNASKPLDKVTITSVFRFSDKDILITESGKEFSYSGRLYNNNMTESLGSFIDKNQISASSSVKLRNNDGLLSNIYHNYNMADATVDIFFGTATDIKDYDLIFSGVTSNKSNFTYDDNTFQFAVKDDRSTLLDTVVESGKYIAKDFPVFDQYDLGSPIIYLTLTGAAPIAWVPGTVVKKVNASSPVATVVYISGSNVYMYDYTGTFVAGDSVTGAGVTATVQSVTSLAPSPLKLKGDVGHYIGNVDSLSDLNHPVATSANILSYWTRKTWYGGFANYEPIFLPKTFTIYAPEKGYIHNIVYNVTEAVGAMAGTVTITTPSKTITKPLLVAGVANNVVLDLSADSLQVFGGNISFTFRITQIGSKEINAFRSTLSNISVNIQKRASDSGTMTTTIPINLNGNTPTGPGSLVFNTTNNNLVNVSVYATTAAVTDHPLGGNVGSGFPVPLTLFGNTVTSVKLVVKINAAPNFKQVVDLISMVIRYPLATVSGTFLPDSIVNTYIPIIYGDFSATPVPTVLLNSKKTQISGHSFANPTTGSLDYTNGTVPLLVGDSIEYTAQSSGEPVVAKITQIIGTTASGTLYFENLGIVPSLAGIFIYRLTNTYKVSASPLHSISNYTYQPKSSDQKQPLPSTVLVDSVNLAKGEFTLTGLNSRDPVFVNCKGKPKLDGTLIESPIDILNDMNSTYLKALTVVVDPLITAELSTIKLRKYINNGDTFRTLLQEIQQSINVASYITTSNALTLFRYNSRIEPDFVFYEDQLVNSNLEEQYDPRTISIPGATFNYNYDFISSNYLSTVDQGVNPGDKSMDLPWVWTDADAANISKSIIDMLTIPPEIVHLSVQAKESVNIKLGNVVSIHRKDTIHDFLVTQYMKVPNSGTVELYGWNLSNDYPFGYPMPSPPVFPKAIQDAVADVWTPATYSMAQPVLMNNTWKTADGVFDPAMGFTTLLNQNNTPIVEGSPFVSTIDITATGLYNICFATDTVLNTPGIGTDISISIDSLSMSAGAGRLYATSVLKSDVKNLVGNAVTDAPFFATPLKALINISTVPAALNTTVTTASNGDCVLVLYIGGTTAGTIIHIGNITIKTLKQDYNATVVGGVVTEGNIFSFKQWNSAWPIIMKKYVMERYRPAETLPNGTIVDVNGNIEYGFKETVL